MHNFQISEHLKEVLRKLNKKNKALWIQLTDKIEEIVSCYSPEHYKNLKYNLKNSKRVHIGHFVLVFQYNKSKDEMLFDDFDHHDNIYKKSS